MVCRGHPSPHRAMLNERLMGMKRTILHVDGDKAFCKVMRRAFEKSGYGVSVACDRLRAIELLSKRSFDLIISELEMPKLDGIELMEEINRREINVPVIFLTSNSEIESYMDLMNMGAFDYLHKPIKEQEILRVVKDAFETIGKSRISLTSPYRMEHF